MMHPRSIVGFASLTRDRGAAVQAPLLARSELACPLLSYDLSKSCAKLELLPGTAVAVFGDERILGLWARMTRQGEEKTYGRDHSLPGRVLAKPMSREGG